MGGSDRIRELFTVGELQSLLALVEKESAPAGAPEPPNEHHHHDEALSVEQRKDELGGLLECEPDSNAMLVNRMRSSSGLVQNRFVLSGFFHLVWRV